MYFVTHFNLLFSAFTVCSLTSALVANGYSVGSHFFHESFMEQQKRRQGKSSPVTKQLTAGSRAAACVMVATARAEQPRSPPLTWTQLVCTCIKEGGWSLCYKKMMSLYGDPCYCSIIEVSEYDSFCKPEYRADLAEWSCCILPGSFFFFLNFIFFPLFSKDDTRRDTTYCDFHSNRNHYPFSTDRTRKK